MRSFRFASISFLVCRAVTATFIRTFRYFKTIYCDLKSISILQIISNFYSLLCNVSLPPPSALRSTYARLIYVLFLYHVLTVSLLCQLICTLTTTDFGALFRMEK